MNYTMEKVTLGNGNLKVSPIVFGAWAAGGWMWGGTEDKASIEAIMASYERGVTSIDTAPVYGLGHSEKIVGTAVKKIGRDKVEILTKYGWNWKVPHGEPLMKGAAPGQVDQPIYSFAGKTAVIQECEDSLRRLKTDYIDLYQIHRPDDSTPIEETMEAMNILIEQGKIREIGVSNHSVDLMERASKVAHLTSTQSPYSMIYRKIEQDILPYSIEKGVGVLAYSPLQRGLLTGKIKADHKFNEGDHRSKNKFYSTNNIITTNNFLAEIKPVAEKYGMTLGQLVLNWTLNQKGITAAIVGARNTKQATENAGSIASKLEKNDIDFIDEKLKKLEVMY